MRSGPNSPRRLVITSKRRRCTATRPTAGERSPTCPSVLMPSSARAAACAPSETRARRCRSPKRGTCSRQWATSLRLPRRRSYSRRRSQRRRRPQTARSGVRGETSAVARRRVLRPRHELPPLSPAHVRAQRRPEVRDRAARDLTRV